MNGAVFMITVTGEMSETLRDQFDDVQLTVGHGVSHLRVVSADAAALHGLLHRLDVLGLELLDVRPIDDMPD
ncbi:MAG TPA: hypothetical protein VIT64_14535 [Ilumatobacteraceae bacterium]|jgi:hypothetical protein